MTQLTYQAAFDVYHTMFRILRLRAVLTDKNIHLDAVRIADYFLAFPYRLSIVKFRQENRSFRKLPVRYENLRPYGDRPSDWTLFGRMESIQHAALSTLGVEEYLDLNSLSDSMVRFTERKLNEPMQERIDNKNRDDHELVSALAVLLEEYPLTGSNGLKQRSGLMEHRYDAV